jgi:hypothetical protein
VIREGKLVDTIKQQIEDDEDIAVLVLGASEEAMGPARWSPRLRRASRRAGSQSPSPSCPAISTSGNQALA